MGWWSQLLGGRVADNADSLQVLLRRLYRLELTLAYHLDDRARGVRFGPDQVCLERLAECKRQNARALACEIEGGALMVQTTPPARRPGALTVPKLIQDSIDIDDLDRLFRQARWLTPDEALRDRLEALAVEEGHSFQVVRRILGAMDSYVTDRQ